MERRILSTPSLAGAAAAGLLAVALLNSSGCMSEVVIAEPKMPTVRPVAPVAPVPVVSPQEATATALAAAQRDDTEAMQRAFDALPSEARGGVVSEVFTTLAAQDTAKAGRLVQALPAGSAQNVATEVAVRAMIARDPAAATEWALAWPATDAGTMAREAAANQLIARDAPGTLSRLLALPASDLRNQMFGFASAEWARRDAPAALSWARDLPANELKTRAATSMGFALAQTQPQRAIDVVSWLPEGRDRWLLLTEIAQTWVARDANAAWKWAQQLPADGSREAAVVGLEAGLGVGGTRTAFVGAPGSAVGGAMSGGQLPLSPGYARASGGLPVGLDRDLALRREFDTALSESPVRAAIWLSSQLSVDRRDEMVDEVARRWLAINPEAAKNWMNQNIFLPERKARLLQEAGR